MSEIWQLIINNLENVGIGVAIFVGAYITNMLLGIYYNVETLDEDFDWYKIKRSIIKIICVGIGIVLLTLTITVIVPFANAIGFSVNAQYQEVINVVATLSITLSASLKYLKEAYNKLTNILNGVNEKER